MSGLISRYLCSEFVAIVLRSPFFQNAFASEKLGSAQARINLGDLRTFPFPIPSEEEQHEIRRRVEALFRLAEAIEKRVAAATARAEKLTEAILAKAFWGELVPTETELARREGRSYEPAPVLLARVRNSVKPSSVEQQPAKLSNRKRNSHGELTRRSSGRKREGFDGGD